MIGWSRARELSVVTKLTIQERIEVIDFARKGLPSTTSRIYRGDRGGGWRWRFGPRPTPGCGSGRPRRLDCRWLTGRRSELA